MAERTSPDEIRADGGRPEKERRRSPRFNCGGHVEINWLPSNGIYVPGKVRDLSLEGCCIDTTVPIEPDMRAEILVRVKANSFRAVGEVRQIRSGSGAGLEFVRLSTGGRELLADLVARLARIQADIDKLKTETPPADPELFRKELAYRKLQAELLRTRFPYLASIAAGPEESSKQEESASGDKVVLVEKPLIIAIDLFG